MADSKPEGKPTRFGGDLHSPSHRLKLPATMPSRNEFSVWNIFKHFVGKDLTKITMPVILNEPLSFQQRLCEYLDYSELLDRAAQCDDPVERFEWVLAFTISANASSEARLQKPFNPVLGETFEFARFPDPHSNGSSNDGDEKCDGKHNQHSSKAETSSETNVDSKPSNGHNAQANGDAHHSTEQSNEREMGQYFRGFRYVSEQVSHHPPVTAFYAEQAVSADAAASGERPGWSLTGAVEPKVKFWGKLFEIEPRGPLSLTLTRYQETYTWANPGFFVHNVLLGFNRIWVEIQGEPELRCVQTGWHARMRFQKGGGSFFDTRPRTDRLHRVSAFICDADGKQRSAIYGKWTEAIYAVSPDELERHASQEAASSQHESSLSSSQSLFDLHLHGQRRLWKVAPRPHDAAAKYYNFTELCMQLNDLDWLKWFPTVLPKYQRPRETIAPRSEHEHREQSEDNSQLSPRNCWVVPRTDSRLRGDMRLMEHQGDLEAAGAEKSRIEEKQRESRKQRGKKDHTPAWFRAAKKSEEGDWVFTHEYWQRDWSKSADLF